MQIGRGKKRQKEGYREVEMGAKGKAPRGAGNAKRRGAERNLGMGINMIRQNEC